MELSSRDWKGIQLQSSFFFINNEALKKKEKDRRQIKDRS